MLNESIGLHKRVPIQKVEHEALLKLPGGCRSQLRKARSAVDVINGSVERFFLYKLVIVEYGSVIPGIIIDIIGALETNQRWSCNHSFASGLFDRGIVVWDG